MQPDMWKRKIGESAWAHIMASKPARKLDGEPAPKMDGIVEEMMAGVLNRAVEVGFQVPERAPQVDPKGTKVIWPTSTHNVGVLTSRGLLEFYERKGHAYLIFKLPQLLRGVGQFLLPRLQEIVAAYEAQCEVENVNPLPLNDRIFVGADRGDRAMLDGLRQGAPEPQKPTDRVVIP